MNIKEGLKTICQSLKPVFISVLKILCWLVLFIILCLLADYNTYKSSLSVGIVVTCYICIIITHFNEKKSFEEWQQLKDKNEFYQEFCNQWQPNIWSYLFVFWVGLKFCNNFEFITILLFSYCFNLWDRRYITNNIKQDLILRELKENCKKEF